MGTLTTIVLVILGISFLVFVIFFGRIPALRNTPIATLNRIILVHIPNTILNVDNKLTSGRFTSWLLRFGNSAINDRHPTVLIFYILLLSVSEYFYLPEAWPHLALFHKVAGTISICLPYIFLYLAAGGDPGYITHANHAYHMQLYPYDFSIFQPGHECRTCHFLKPARSKHCSICKRCVGRMDHHCIFINKCVGYRNHRWFVLLLLSTAVLATYGCAMGVTIMATQTQERFPFWSLWPPKDMDYHQYLLGWSWALQQSLGLGAVTILTGMLSPMVWSLLAYTVYLVYCGTTTNETLKWSDWKADMDDGLAFKRRMSPNRQKFTTIEPAWTRWPVETEQILVCREDGQPPPEDAPLPGEGLWERVWKLRDVENMYDLGFLNNFKDIFFLDYQFERGRLPSIGRRGMRHKAPRASPL